MNSKIVISIFCLAIATTVLADFKIVNGSTAVQHEFPQMVSIKLLNDHFCGGTLLNGNTVLTAAHCVWEIRNFDKQMMRDYKIHVVLGEYDQDRVHGDEKVFQVTETRMHPKYTYEEAFEYGNDIAVIKFAGYISHNEVPYIKYAEYSRAKSVQPGDRCEVVGWGSLDPHGMNGARLLQKATLNILSSDECAKTFRNVRYEPTNICAGSGRLSTSACKGDSGGPLFCKNSRGENVQVGIVSYGRVPCGQYNVPTVYTRVSELSSWISRNMYV